MDSLNLYTSKEIYITNNLYEYIREVMEMPGRLSTAEEKYNIMCKYKPPINNDMVIK